MKFGFSKANLPGLKNIGLTVLSVIFLTLAFPDFDQWYFAWFAVVPLFIAIESEKASILRSAFLGWIFGAGFLFGTCWWLTFAMITYGGIPCVGAYFLVFIIVAIVGLYFAVFGGLLSYLFRRMGSYAVFAAPFVWTALEFTRYHLTFNNWNEIAYSQAFVNALIQPAQYGGIYLVGFLVLLSNSFLAFIFLPNQKTAFALRAVPIISVLIILCTLYFSYQSQSASIRAADETVNNPKTNVVAVQG